MARTSRSGLWSALGLAFELGYLIAIPLVVFALVGRLLDRRFGTSPWILLVGVLCSLIVSSVAVTRKARAILRSDHVDYRVRQSTNGE